MRIRVFLSHPCGHNNCGLADRIQDLPAVDSVFDISELRSQLQADATGPGLILIVGGVTVQPEALQRCSQALETLITVSRGYAHIRLWPIVLVSPEATALARELRETQGSFDLTEEFWAEVIAAELDSGVRRDADLCGSDELLQALQHVFQRRILPRLGAMSQDATSVRAWANLRQCGMILRRGAASIHYDMHQASSGLDALGSRPLDIAASIADQELAHIITPERLREFRDRVIGGDQSAPTLDADTVATYLEECAASLELGSRMPRSGDRRVVILLIDDQPDILAEMKRSLEEQPDLRVEAIDCGPKSAIGMEMETAVAKEATSTSDLSVMVGKIVFGELECRLNELNAAQLWLRDGWRFFVASDVRLHQRAPSGGLELVRRVRDAFPYVSTIAVTVRRGLAYQLQDEGADGYLLKSKDHQSTAEDLWKMIERTVQQADAYYIEGDLKLTRTDQFFWPLLERKYFMRAAELGDQRIRFACFRQRKDVAESLAILRRLPTEAVVSVLMDSDATPLDLWEQLRNWRDHRDRRIVLLKRAAPARGGSIADGSGTKLCPSSVLHLDKALRPEPERKFNRRWTLLVPRSAHCGALNVVVEDDELERYRVVLSERFGGATTNEVAGVWLESARRIEVKDNNQRIEVFGRGTESAGHFLRDLGQKILRELGQEEIFLQEDTVSVWSLKPASFPPLPVDIERDGLLDLPFAAFAAEAVGL